MSAFIVSNELISALCDSVSRANIMPRITDLEDQRLYFNTDQRRIGQILLDENIRSVADLYHPFPANMSPCFDTPGSSFCFTRPPRTLTPIEIVKLCDCLVYQSCETDNYYDSKAYEIVQAIKHHAIIQIDGYQTAQWSI